MVSGCSAAVHVTRIPLLSICYSVKRERVKEGRGNQGDEREKQEQKDELEGLESQGSHRIEKVHGLLQSP